MALAEWHIPPDHIVNNWSEEMFALMVKYRNERVETANAAASGGAVPEFTVRDLKPNYGEQAEGEQA